MYSIKKKLALLILGQKGGVNRMNILNTLSERPFNTSQLAEVLELNYHTVQYHIKILLENEIITSSNSGGYGDVFFLAPELDANRELLEGIGEKLASSSVLTSFVSSDVFFKRVMEQINDIVIILNTKAQIFFWNKSAEKLFGYSKKEVIGEEIQIFSNKGFFKDIVTNLAATNPLTAYATKATDKQGETIDIEITITVINDEHEKKIGYALLARNITERVKEETTNRENEQALSLIFENSTVGTILLNNDITINMINEAASSIMHLDVEGIRGLRPGDAFQCIQHIESSGGCGTGIACRTCQIRGITSDTARTGEPYDMVEASLNIKDDNALSTAKFTLSTVPIYHKGERKVLLIIHSVDFVAEP